MRRFAALAFLAVLFISVAGWSLFGQRSREKYYVGEKTCRQCHHQSGDRDQFNPWRLTAHAKAYAALSKPEAREIAELSGIEVDPYDSPICLGCHTTAYATEEWERGEDFHFEDGIQCERCHGPGSLYSDADIMQDRTKAMGAGLKMPEKSDCLVCHKEKGSHMAVLHVKKWEYEEALKEIAHPGMGGRLTQKNTPAATPLPGPQYVSALACGSCHDEREGGNQYNKWRYSGHAQAYAVLDTKRAREIADDMGLSGDPQKSGQCLECHATAAGEPAGRLTEHFDPAQGVQCESCHGPGSEYMPEAIMRDPVAAAQAGLQDVDEQTCVTCHTEGIHGHDFDFKTMWAKIDHSKWREEYSEVEYKTPFNLAVSQDGNRLFVACEASNSMIAVDPGTNQILAEVPIGVQPHFVALSPDGRRAYVSNRGSDNVSVIDTKTYKVLSTITVGDEPHEIAITNDGKTMYVVNAGTYDISVVDLAQGKEVKRLAASRGPWGAALSPDGRYVYVSNNLPRFGKFRAASQSEITRVDTRNATVSYRYTVNGANLLQGIAVSPDNAFALTTLIRTKNLVPMTRNIQGWIMTNGLGILWPDGRVDQLLLDEQDDFFADPTDLVFSNDGKYAFVTGSGVQEVAMIDIQKMKAILAHATPEERREDLPNHLNLSMDYGVQRIPVGRSPRGMAVSPDDRLLYVADGLDDAISVVDIRKRQEVKTIDLGGPDEITQARYGERIFHSAQYTYARQFSCHSCHPDGGIDGITYDIEPDGLGYNPVDNRTLRGVNDTAPFKWTGKNPTLQRQCGPRLAAFFTRIDPFTAEQSAALERYIVTIPRPPNRYRTSEELTPAQRRGKRIFEREYDNSDNPIPPLKQCHYCHRPPYFTDRELANVGTASWLDTQGTFDVPHLNNIYATAPYLHDGRASSLEEIWTKYNPNDTHGQTNDLTKDQLNDLIEYLKTL